MGMNVNTEIARVAQVLSRYAVPEAERLTIIRILLDAGVEQCLNEQQRIRDEKEAMIHQACGLVN